MDEQGLNDAAIMLMSLGEEEAAEVFKHFSPKEAQKLGETIARTRTVSREKVDEVIHLVRNSGGLEYAQEAMYRYRDEAFALLRKRIEREIL